MAMANLDSSVIVCVMRMIRAHNDGDDRAFRNYADFFAEKVETYSEDAAARVRRTIAGKYGATVVLMRTPPDTPTADPEGT